jgi:GMP synthase (glutamine-hydrolysing)
LAIFSAVRFLLFQARNPGDEAQPHEVMCFQEVLGDLAAEIRPWDLLGGCPTRAQLDEVDCVLVGGSGEYGVTGHQAPWLREFIDFMGELASEGFPTFASCFGFQALVLAAGGAVETDKSRSEVGTLPLTVTPEGHDDPLLGPLAPTFYAQFGHKDHATKLPSGVVNLASTPRTPYQALRVDGHPVYATQFHPELSMHRNRERFMRYLEGYSDAEMADTPDEIMARFQDTTSSSDLLRRYVTEILHRHTRL